MSATNKTADPPKGLFPALPTIKVLAMGKLTPQATPWPGRGPAVTIHVDDLDAE